ncbi:MULTISPECIES: nucleoside diphosphate kinase regulator [Brucella/Ochrobactrum group]|jgi:regulator of nucleoside diphosphate kinase|uniref:nucleoside diphosphate kinase regulator n=1 Tax=Brucella/Ochrobactrum group TaxID=2826938 RepID=UPI001C05E2A9|nr:nucleoside diphosphate kinase regulator [Brucella sp. NBRC 12950]QWK79979.1 nucleoside diphosphate kinase regulator [Ochrobactrum sp. BTU1]GLU27144.1 nucleoside diphosphate kinase regulator [Brucella sp. NBRC 12950]
MSEKNRKKPKIVVSDIDHERLTILAGNVSEKLEEVAEELMQELDRAKVVPQKKLPADVVRMGSMVEFRSNDGHERKVTLVYPGEADIAQGKISILTPIGTALIGLTPGQSMSWIARDGKAHELSIISVSNAEAVSAA